jgi:hypothetical protein
MLFRISHPQDRPAEGALLVWHPVHAAGTLPNGMNRFLQSNAQEVLFVI